MSSYAKAALRSTAGGVCLVVGLWCIASAPLALGDGAIARAALDLIGGCAWLRWSALALGLVEGGKR